MDFSPQDRLVLNVSESNLLVKNNNESTFITGNTGFLIQLIGFPEFSVAEHALFENFETH